MGYHFCTALEGLDELPSNPNMYDQEDASGVTQMPPGSEEDETSTSSCSTTYVWYSVNANPLGAESI